MSRKIIVVVATALQLALVMGLLTWHVTRNHNLGWTGLGYAPEVGIDAERFTAGSPFGGRSRQVAVIAPRSPAAGSDIRDQDLMVSINGIPTADLKALRELHGSISSGDILTYVVEDERGRREISLVLESPFRSSFVVANLATSVVVGLIWLVISLLVYWSRPQSQPASVFFLLCSTGATMYFVWGVSEMLFPNIRGILPLSFDPLSMSAFALLAVLSVLFANMLLHLSLVFPKRRPITETWPKVFHWLHTVPFLQFVVLPAIILAAWSGRKLTWLIPFEVVTSTAIVVVLLQLISAARREGWRAAIATRPIRTQLLLVLVISHLGLAIRLVPDKAGFIVGILFGFAAILIFFGWVSLYSVLTCIALYRSYRESGTEVRNQIRWPMWGTLTALAGSLIILIASIIIGYSSSTLGATAYSLASAASVVNKAVYLLIPVGFAFAILKHRLLDIHIIIRKTVIYSGVTGVVLVLYLLLAGVSGVVFVRAAGLQSETATVFSTLAVVALFVPIRNRVQAFVDRRFFQRERDLEAARIRISNMVATTTDIDDVLAALAEESQEALHTRSIAIFTRSGKDLRVEASVGLPDSHSPPLTLDVAHKLLSTKNIVVNVATDEIAGDASRTLKRTRSKKLAVARRGTETVGLIAAGPKLSGEDFDHEDETFLESLAEQLTLAIGRSDQNRSRAELSRAREIQQSLLPSVLPAIAGVDVAARWQPAREVGGDYYDALRLGDHRLALCIGDVVGKGMPAALLMSSLQASLRAVVSQVQSPRDVCTQVRRVILQSLAGGTFITFFFCVIDRAAGVLAYTNAGHNPPLLVRGDGSMQKLRTGGPILARIAAEVPFEEGTIAIGPGDRLVLYTDGVTEASDSDDDMFEEERLEALVRNHRAASAAELEEKIVEAVIGHAEGRLQDDLTLVIAAIS